jgi:hypothetical protein
MANLNRSGSYSTSSRPETVNIFIESSEDKNKVSGKEKNHDDDDVNLKKNSGNKKVGYKKNEKSRKKSAAEIVTVMPSQLAMDDSLSSPAKSKPLRGLTENEFRAKCKEAGLSDKESEETIRDVIAFVKKICEPDDAERKSLEKNSDDLAAAKNLPYDISIGRQIKTVASAGVAAYLTSFFFGKLAANFTVFATGSPHGVWIFPVAGLLNVLITEPVANGIRTNGAAYGSPDGVAYTDYRTGQARLELAKKHNDVKKINKWTLFCSKIIDGLIDREQKAGLWINSGVHKPKRDSNGNPVTQDGNPLDFHTEEADVIAKAKWRAFISDELPFFWFSANYTVSGGMVPILKARFAPLEFAAIDLGISAGLGMLSGAQTALSQNVLRKNVQGANLNDGMSKEVKAAHLELARNSMRIWREKIQKIDQVIVAINAKRSALIAKAGKGQDVSDLVENCNKNLKEIKKKREETKEKLMMARRLHRRYSSQFLRVGHAIGQSMNAYAGEKSDDAKPMEGRRAINRNIAKVISYPLSLCAVCIYNSVVIPAVLGAVKHASASAVSVLNATSDPAFMNGTSVEPVGPASPVNLTAAIALGAAAGLPLIMGFVMRTQALSGFFEALITDHEPRRTPKVTQVANLKEVVINKDRIDEEGADSHADEEDEPGLKNSRANSQTSADMVVQSSDPDSDYDSDSADNHAFGSNNNDNDIGNVGMPELNIKKGSVSRGQSHIADASADSDEEYADALNDDNNGDTTDNVIAATATAKNEGTTKLPASILDEESTVSDA